jgi:hypothetical protein
VRKTILACAAVALIVGSTSATAATLITGKDIKDGTVTAQDIKRGSINSSRLTRGVREQLKRVGAQGGQGVSGPKGDKGDSGAAGGKGDKGDRGGDGAKGDRGDSGAPGEKGDRGVAGLESDGPYPGATDLGSLPRQGDNSDQLWTSGGRQTSWVQCPPRKFALGGGFHLAADAGDVKARQVQVVVSEPTQIKDGILVNEPINGDEAMSIKPNGWLVQGFYDGEGEVIVRPWVVCARVD